jgi:hypothetical protein
MPNSGAFSNEANVAKTTEIRRISTESPMAGPASSANQ